MAHGGNNHQQTLLKNPDIRKMFTKEERENLRPIHFGTAAKTKRRYHFKVGTENILTVFCQHTSIRCVKIDNTKPPFPPWHDL